MHIRFTFLVLLQTVALCVFMNKISAQIIYVKSGGSGDGTSWQKPLNTLTNALAKVKAGQQIWVAQGVYTPTTCNICTQSDRKISFIIPDSVKVYGGFVGTETNINQRDWKNNRTTLSGDIDNDGKPDKNSMRLVYTINVSSFTMLDGFTVANANANDTTVVAGEYFNSGSAFFNDGRFAASSPTISNCTFINNYSVGFGGALYNNAAFNGLSNAQITQCIFRSNKSHSVGAAVHNNGSAGGKNFAHYEFCIFDSNTSDEAGGAVFNDGDGGLNQTFFANCQFINNYGAQYGGAIYNLGAHGESSPAILNCLFWKNNSYSAGAIYNLGSAKGKANAQILNCTFYKNSAHTSGAIYANANDTTGTSVPTIVNSIFWKNTADNGNTFRCIYGNPKISYSIVDTTECNALNSGVGSNVVCGSGMLYNLNPIFENPDSGDFRLKPGSFAIDAGNNTIVNALNLKYDLDSTPRIYNNKVDLGCYEYSPNLFFAPQIVNPLQASSVCEKQNAQLILKVSGTPPLTYNWYKNNSAYAQTSSDTLNFLNVRVQDSGYYYVIVSNSKNQTLKTDSVFLNISPFLIVSVNLMILKSPICINDSITIKANIANGGAKPKLNWQLNNASLGAPDSAIIITTPVGSNFFKYKCIVTSSEKCTVQNQITSTILNVSYNDSVAMKANLTSTPTLLEKNKPITFKIDGTNIGSAPSIKWFLNGKLLTTNALTYTTDSLKSKDVVSSIVTSSLTCAKPNQISLATTPIIFSSTFDTSNDDLEVRIFPNPIENNALSMGFSEPQILESIACSDAMGKSIFFLKGDKSNSRTDFRFDIPNVNSGFYFLQIKTSRGLYVRKLFVFNR